MRMGEQGRIVRLGIVGLGGRGTGQMQTLQGMPDVRIAAVCDVYPDRVERAQELARQKQDFTPEGTLDYRELNARDDLEAVVVMSSWTTHILVAVDAMKKGKRAAMEVGGAASIEECWEMVRTMPIRLVAKTGGVGQGVVSSQAQIHQTADLGTRHCVSPLDEPTRPSRASRRSAGPPSPRARARN